jgi:hypothetical protein
MELYYKKYKNLFIDHNILLNNFEEEKERLLKLWDNYKDIVEKFERKNDEIKKLKSDIIDTQLKIIELKDILTEKNKLISGLKERLGELNSDWHVEAGLAWRNHPTTKKIEKYKVPKNFDIKYIEDIDFNEETQMVKFNYKAGDRSNYGNSYEIPILLYTYLGGKLFLLSNKKQIDSYQHINIDDLKQKIVEKGGNIHGKYTDIILKFSLDNQGKIFTAKEFCKKCNITSRQTGNYYLNKLIEWGLIIKVKRGLYKCKNL